MLGETSIFELDLTLPSLLCRDGGEPLVTSFGLWAIRYLSGHSSCPILGVRLYYRPIS